MYKVSYEKCVCFIFLVILAVLSCSGFRIDNLAMTDISKRNSHTSSSLNSDEFFDRLFSVDRHRIRHHRQLRVQAQRYEKPATGRIDTIVLPPSTTQPSENLAQIPSTDVQSFYPTRPIFRSQRSSDQRTRKRRQHLCQELDVSWKAYVADTVVIATAESMRKNRRDYTVLFKVQQTIKTSAFPVQENEHVSLKFSNDTTNHCGYDGLPNRPHSLVKAKIEKSKEYILFLNGHGAHNFSVAGVPEPRRRKTPHSITRVTSSNFKPKPVKVERLERPLQNKKRLKLVCKVKGFPIPFFIWKHDNISLHSNLNVRITYKKKKSTLVIRNPSEADLGLYECIAQGADGSRASKVLHVSTLSTSKAGTPCEEKYKKEFCFHGGTCYYEESLGELWCECPNGFSGKQCEEKRSDQSSELDDNS